jgi:hypothetical protein
MAGLCALMQAAGGLNWKSAMAGGYTIGDPTASAFGRYVYLHTE